MSISYQDDKSVCHDIEQHGEKRNTIKTNYISPPDCSLFGQNKVIIL